MSSNSKFALGALIGAVAGVVTGILTAPKSGKETRADIKAKSAELKDVATEKAGQVKDKAVKLTEDVKSKVDEFRKHDDKNQ